MWHQGRIATRGDRPQDLCIETLVDCGEAVITTEAILEAAKDVVSPVFQPQVVWRPDEVKSPWFAWSDAHVNVQSNQPSSGFPEDYRKILSERCYVSRPPREAKVNQPVTRS